MEKLSEYSGPDIVRMLGANFKDYRMRRLMTQRDVAEQAGISPLTVHKFESGTATNISLATLIALMRAIGLVDKFAELLPTLPPSPYLMTRQYKPKQRIRKPKSGTL